MKEPANSLARINVGYICLKKRFRDGRASVEGHPATTTRRRRSTPTSISLVYLQREMYEDAQSASKNPQARAEPDRGLLRAGARVLFA